MITILPRVALFALMAFTAGCMSSAPAVAWHEMKAPWKAEDFTKHPEVRATLDDGRTVELRAPLLETRADGDWLVSRLPPAAPPTTAAESSTPAAEPATPASAPEPPVAVPLAHVQKLEGTDAHAERIPVPKPWDAAAVESRKLLWIELANGKHGFLFDGHYVVDPAGDYLTSANDANVKLALADVRVMDEVRGPTDEDSGPPVQSVAGSLFVLWTAFLLFLPAIILVVVLT